MQELLYSTVQYSECFSTYAAASVSKAENTCALTHDDIRHRIQALKKKKKKILIQISFKVKLFPMTLIEFTRFFFNQIHS